MVYKFCVLSDEVDDFRREIEIDADATFQDFNKVLLKTCNYKSDLMTSFFICDEYWDKQQEITAVDMNEDPKAAPIPLMEKTHIIDMIPAEMAEKKADFETRLKRLEEIVEKMENETLPLEESIALFEEGQKLIKNLAQDLEEAEKKIGQYKTVE